MRAPLQIIRKNWYINFKKDESIQMFLISVKADGVGLHLNGADYVYIVALQWNPTIYYQAINKTNRIGQSKKYFRKNNL